MGYGTILARFDVAQLAIYVFWGAFAALIYYLRREDHREGYPLVPDAPGTDVIMFPPVPPQKLFVSPHGEAVAVPRPEEAGVVNGAVKAQPWAGAPYIPEGDPLLAAMGPAAFAQRSPEPEHLGTDLLHEDGGPKVLPLRAAPSYYLAAEDTDPRHMAVVGNDGKVAGHVTDVWIDRGEVQVRYFEIQLVAEYGGDAVLMPVIFGEFDRKRHELICEELTAAQIGRAPRISGQDGVSLLEDDRISAYFGGGRLYGKASRVEPVL